MKNKNMVSEPDRALLKAAMNVLKRLAKREMAMDSKARAAQHDMSKDYNAISDKHWKFVGELESLGVHLNGRAFDGLKLVASLK